jgi:hypothetical protein
MKLFIAGQGVPRQSIFDFRKANRKAGREIAFLHSYLEIKGGNHDLLTKYLEPNNYFLDSGAFTAFTQGKQIDIDHYIETIKSIPNIKNYAVLDVIGDYKKTAKNLKYMQDKGVAPIPAFHFGSPEKELVKLLEDDRYDYIALGGLVPYAAQRPKLESWLDYCYSIITKYPLKKTHLFGINSLWAWKKYPIYSADATSWVCGSKFRRIVEFQPKTFSFNTHTKNTLTSRAHQVTDGDYISLNLHNIIEYQKAADATTRLWSKRGITWED